MSDHDWRCIDAREPDYYRCEHCGARERIPRRGGDARAPGCPGAPSAETFRLAADLIEIAIRISQAKCSAAALADMQRMQRWLRVQAEGRYDG